MNRAEYEGMVCGLDASLQAWDLPVDVVWDLEGWEAFVARNAIVGDDGDGLFRVRWKSEVEEGWVSGSLIFNPAILMDAGPKWMSDALTDMVLGNLEKELPIQDKEPWIEE